MARDESPIEIRDPGLDAAGLVRRVADGVAQRMLELEARVAETEGRLRELEAGGDG